MAVRNAEARDIARSRAEDPRVRAPAAEKKSSDDFALRRCRKCGKPYGESPRDGVTAGVRYCPGAGMTYGRWMDDRRAVRSFTPVDADFENHQYLRRIAKRTSGATDVKPGSAPKRQKSRGGRAVFTRRGESFGVKSRPCR